MSASELIAPGHWQCVDFVADLHLQQADATFDAFFAYLQSTPAQAVFLLGDILELWPGDDALQHPAHAFERQLVEALHTISANKALYFMHGNRDFMVGQAFCTAAGMTLLEDPCVLQMHTPENGALQRVLLSHGDALCIGDTAYMQLRQQVRNPAWQQQVLQLPLEQRRALAQQLRQQSSQRKNELGVEGYADVDEPLAVQRLQERSCTTLVHGHTHKPQDHVLATSLDRKVLSDWDLQAAKPRGEVLRLQATQQGWLW
ncbi:MAG: UDP-2,3-diacylglucosamine diphosphatase, partial [Brachymonas sp.]|nr:UDP-2,3-diacylglucosamine diphosphatase [Brachymonas sp.]